MCGQLRSLQSPVCSYFGVIRGSDSILGLGVVGAQQCSGDTAYIWPSAQISVAGEPGTTYDPHMQCGFVIQPTLGSSLITLEFDYFDTEDGYDFVCAFPPSTLVLIIFRCECMTHLVVVVHRSQSASI